MTWKKIAPKLGNRTGKMFEGVLYQILWKVSQRKRTMNEGQRHAQ